MHQHLGETEPMQAEHTDEFGDWASLDSALPDGATLPSSENGSPLKLVISSRPSSPSSLHASQWCNVVARIHSFCVSSEILANVVFVGSCCVCMYMKNAFASTHIQPVPLLYLLQAILILFFWLWASWHVATWSCVTLTEFCICARHSRRPNVSSIQLHPALDLLCSCIVPSCNPM